MEKAQSELAVVTKAKDLARYVTTITQKSPKQYRFTFTSRMQNLCLDIIFLLIHHDKKFLRDCLAMIREMVEDELKLKLNSKTQIAPLKNGVEFLGWRYYLSETGKVVRRLKAQSKLRFKRGVRKLAQEFEAGTIGADEMKMRLAGYHGHLKHGHTYRLRRQTGMIWTV